MRRTKPPHEPTDKTRNQVKGLSAVGVRFSDIAKIVGVSIPTLRKHYKDELELGKIEATAKVAQTLFQQATKRDKPNMGAAMFWLKTQAGWREKDSPEKPLGKKEIADEKAKTAGKGKFGPGRAPRLAIDNTGKKK